MKPRRPMMPYSRARQVLNLPAPEPYARPNGNYVQTRVDIERNLVTLVTYISGEQVSWIELMPNGGGLDELIKLLCDGRDSLKASRQ